MQMVRHYSALNYKKNHLARFTIIIRFARISRFTQLSPESLQQRNLNHQNHQIHLIELLFAGEAPPFSERAFLIWRFLADVTGIVKFIWLDLKISRLSSWEPLEI